MTITEIRARLQELATKKMKAFGEKLISSQYPILGVSNPDMSCLQQKSVWCQRMYR